MSPFSDHGFDGIMSLQSSLAVMHVPSLPSVDSPEIPLGHAGLLVDQAGPFVVSCGPVLPGILVLEGPGFSMVFLFTIFP